MWKRFNKKLSMILKFFLYLGAASVVVFYALTVIADEVVQPIFAWAGIILGVAGVAAGVIEIFRISINDSLKSRRKDKES